MASEITEGSKVMFGRSRGERTFGTVLRVTVGGKFKVRQDEARGKNPIGTVWTVPASLCSLAHPDMAPTDAEVQMAKVKAEVDKIRGALLRLDNGASPDSAGSEYLALRAAFLAYSRKVGH